MIHIYGTSHVSEESIELIDEKIDEHDPEIVGLELDAKRLQALLTGDSRSNAPIFIRLVKYFQDKVGQRTGVMPGDEMLHAYQRCGKEDRDIALIDQDIRVTLQRLNQIRRKEKVKAAGSLLLGLILPGSFDLSEIPEDEDIRYLLEETRHRFPGIYQVLVEERNVYMATALQHLQEDHPGKDIVAFVGAGHKEALREILEEVEFEYEESEEDGLKEEPKEPESSEEEFEDKPDEESTEEGNTEDENDSNSRSLEDF